MRTLKLVGLGIDSAHGSLNIVAPRIFPTLADYDDHQNVLGSLRSISLADFNLAGAEQYVLKATRCGELESLTIERCCGLPEFFNHLGAWLTKNGSKLQRIKWHTHAQVDDRCINKFANVLDRSDRMTSIWLMLPRTQAQNLRMPWAEHHKARTHTSELDLLCP